MHVRRSYYQGRLRSFAYAWQGVRAFFRKEKNASLHLVATLGVVMVLLLVPLKAMECVMLVVSTALVWAFEMVNTALEKAMDLVCPRPDPRVKFIKDVSAAAVLVVSLAAAVTALLILLPKL